MGAVVGRWRDTSKWSQSNQNTSRHILVDGSKYTVDNIRTHIILGVSSKLRHPEKSQASLRENIIEALRHV